MSDEQQIAEQFTSQQAAPQNTANFSGRTDQGGKPIMVVKIYAPFEVFYEGDAYSVSAVNALGPFDVLPHHHNFLCMVVSCTVRVVTAEGTKLFKVSRALMHIKADRVAVFVDV